MICKSMFISELQTVSIKRKFLMKHIILLNVKVSQYKRHHMPKQIDAVLPLKTRCHAVLLRGLITQA